MHVSKRKLLKTAAIIAYEHHENFDSTGYPRCLKGDEISLVSRIVALVDVFDALATKRVYKEIWAQDEILDFIVSLLLFSFKCPCDFRTDPNQAVPSIASVKWCLSTWYRRFGQRDSFP